MPILFLKKSVASDLATGGTRQQMGTRQQIMVITDRIKRRVTGALGISATTGTSAKGETSVITRVRNLRRFFGLLLRVYTRFYPRYFLGRAFSIS
jgi:hypothetical protein